MIQDVYVLQVVSGVRLGQEAQRNEGRRSGNCLGWAEDILHASWQHEVRQNPESARCLDDMLLSSTFMFTRDVFPRLKIFAGGTSFAMCKMPSVHLYNRIEFLAAVLVWCKALSTAECSHCIHDEFYARRRLTVARSFISVLDGQLHIYGKAIRWRFLSHTPARNAFVTIDVCIECSPDSSLECSMGWYRSCSVSAGFTWKNDSWEVEACSDTQDSVPAEVRPGCNCWPRKLCGCWSMTGAVWRRKAVQFEDQKENTRTVDDSWWQLHNFMAGRFNWKRWNSTSRCDFGS